MSEDKYTVDARYGHLAPAQIIQQTPIAPLRDQFAMAAIPTARDRLLGCGVLDVNMEVKHISSVAYAIADAMMEERDD